MNRGCGWKETVKGGDEKGDGSGSGRGNGKWRGDLLELGQEVGTRAVCFKSIGAWQHSFPPPLEPVHFAIPHIRRSRRPPVASHKYKTPRLLPTTQGAS